MTVAYKGLTKLTESRNVLKKELEESGSVEVLTDCYWKYQCKGEEVQCIRVTACGDGTMASYRPCTNTEIADLKAQGII